MTKVIFRHLQGETIALFPELPGDVNARITCLSYAHTGQHGAACISDGVLGRPASPEDAQELFKELQAIGYENLTIVKRATRKDYEKRKAALEAKYTL